MTEFEKLFNKNREFIFKFLLKMTSDVSLSEELTGETFFRAYMNYTSLRDKNKASVWLCSIAKNTYYAWCRDQNKKVSLDELGDVTDGESLEETYVRKELSEKALQCLGELEEPYKEVFMLSVFGEVSFKEISTIFGKSESWARVTFYRAKQKLLERMRH